MCCLGLRKYESLEYTCTLSPLLAVRTGIDSNGSEFSINAILSVNKYKTFNVHETDGTDLPHIFLQLIFPTIPLSDDQFDELYQRCIIVKVNCKRFFLRFSLCVLQQKQLNTRRIVQKDFFKPDTTSAMMSCIRTSKYNNAKSLLEELLNLLNYTKFANVKL